MHHIDSATRLLRATIAFALLTCLAFAQGAIPQNPPSTTPPHVEGATGPNSEQKNIEVKKSHNVKVLKMWRKIAGTWYLVWSIDDNINEGLTVTGQTSKTTKITKNDGKFPADTEVVVEIEVADQGGDSTSIVSITFNNNA